MTNYTRQRLDTGMEIGDIVVCVANQSVSCTDELNRWLRGELRHPLKLGAKYQVTMTNRTSYGHFVDVVSEDGIFIGGTYMNQFELLKTTNTVNTMTMTNTISSFMKKITRTEPEKTLLAAGFIDENDNMTEKGQEALVYVLWNENKTKLKDIAEKIVAEKETSVKK